MTLSELSLKRPVLATVMSLGIILLGVVGYNYLGVREYPAIDPPVITVQTTYTGANADVIESQITEPLEKAINGIQGIRTISSTSSQGNSAINVEFNLNVDLDNAANDVRDKVSQTLRSLPQDLPAPPVVSKSASNSDFIIILAVQSRTLSLLQLSDFAENVLQEQLQTIPQVSGINIFGQKRYAMRVWVDPDKLNSYQLTFQDIYSALQNENVELPSGSIAGNFTELDVRTTGRLTNETEFNNLILREDSSGIIRLGDVARVELGPEVYESSFRLNGSYGLGLAIIPQPGANYLSIADEFYHRLSSIQKNLEGQGIQLFVTYDTTQHIRDSLSEVKVTLAIALILVILVIFFFFRNWLIALRPLIDIPICLIGTFFIMYLFNFSVNVLTLLGIVLATGLVVDDGIVVTENIFRKLEAGLDIHKAAQEGTREIFFAVLSTSLTLAVVFLPIIFLQGFIGSLFREFGVVVAGAVLISAFVSLSLTPVLNVILNRYSSRESKFYKATEPFFKGMESGYRKILVSFMRIRWASWLIVGVCLFIIYLIYISLPSELAPLEDRGNIRFLMSAPEGTSYDRMYQLTQDLDDYLYQTVPQRQYVFGVVPGFSGVGNNQSYTRMVLLPEKERDKSQQQIVSELAPKLSQFQSMRIFPIQEQTIAVGIASRGSLPVQFVIENLDFNKLRDAIPKFMTEVRKDPTFAVADVNLKFNQPELEINIDRTKAKDVGVSVIDVGETLQMANSGQLAGYFTMNSRQYEVVAQLDRPDRSAPADLEKLYVRNIAGQLIPLSAVIDEQITSTPQAIFHYNRYKSATISAGLAQGKTIGDGIKAMEQIASRTLDNSFQTALSGPSRDFEESSSNTTFVFILALIFIYLVLAAQFESFTDPFVIMITVPLAMAGALLTLWTFQQTLNIFSEIGMIMLIGLVTKNGILIVEFANQKRAKGEEKFQAVIDAAVQRLRPILMTSLATSLGAVPLILSLGGAATSHAPLGIVVVGGILFSLILTLLVIPAVYTYLSTHKKEEPLKA